MKIEIQDDDLSTRVYDPDTLEKIRQDIIFVDSSSKEDSILQIFQAYLNGQKQVLFDDENQSIKDLLKNNDFKDVEFSMLMFTSGSTGKPTGAFKSRENLEREVDEWIKLVKKFNPKKVISTVPFIHIYGILSSVLLPYRLGIDLFFKKHFLPHDLLQAITQNTVVVTTPLYIKALLQLDEVRDLKDVLFISSTAPLEPEIAKKFINKFNTNLLQFFGSTETGGIAYKAQADELWTPISSVCISTNEESLLKIHSPFVSKLLFEEGYKKTNSMIQSFDYVEFEGDRFKIIGRNSQIFKAGGKRYSTLQVEEILERLESVKKAYVRVNYHKGELKDEVLEIYLESSEQISLKEVNGILKREIGNIKFPISLKIVEKISTTQMGKKVMHFDHIKPS
ncbi:MAG: AMP-binding protein [Sulfurospirillaceae bacterium]|nr:AMP-binding protein [Sulfurospirillaceae bacterium]